MAAKNGFVAVAQCLLRAKANVNQQCVLHETPLIVASALGHETMVRALLAHDKIAVDLPDRFGKAALVCAADKGHTGVVQLLLAAKANAASVNGALLRAAYHNHFDSLWLLLQHSANVNHRTENKVSALHHAALRGHEPVVVALLEANASVDLPNRNNFTALLLAASKGHAAVVDVLLAARADVNWCSEGRLTALHHASLDGHVAVVERLLLGGADCAGACQQRRTALSYATRRGPNRLLALLLEANAAIDAADINGNTPLMWALFYENVESVRFLLEHGARWLVNGKQSARQIARMKTVAVQSLFHCSLCGWSGMCCLACRKAYCVLRCDKFSGKQQECGGHFRFQTDCSQQ